jgi:hypothetical protein
VEVPYLAQARLEAQLKHKLARLTALLNFKQNNFDKHAKTKRLTVRLVITH